MASSSSSNNKRSAVRGGRETLGREQKCSDGRVSGIHPGRGLLPLQKSPRSRSKAPQRSVSTAQDSHNVPGSDMDKQRQSAQDDAAIYHRQLDNLCPKFWTVSGENMTANLSAYLDSPASDRASLVENWICEQLEDDAFIQLCEDVEGVWRRIALGT